MARNELLLKVQFGKKLHKLDLESDLDISRENIGDDMADQPAQFAWYATLYEMAKSRSAHLKYDIDNYRAGLDSNVREEMAKEGLKTTEAGVAAMIKSDRGLQKLEEAYLLSKEEEGRLMVAKQAMEHRKDMLISLGSLMRMEMDTDIKISKEKVRKQLQKKM